MAIYDGEMSTLSTDTLRNKAKHLWGQRRRLMKKLAGQFEYYLAVILLLTYVAILGINIFMRTFTGTQIKYGQEVILGLFAWSTWLGTAHLIKRKEHLRFTGIITRIPNSAVYVLLWVEWILWVAFSIIVIKFSWQQTMELASSNAMVVGTNIPKAMMYASVPVGFAIIIIRVLEQSVEATLKYRQADDLSEYVELEERGSAEKAGEGVRADGSGEDEIEGEE